MQLLLDVSDFAESDLQALLREMRDMDTVESIESLPERLERGTKGDWLNKVLVELQPENLPRFIKSVSDIFWQFTVPPKFIVSVDGKKVRIEVNRKEDLDAAIKKAMTLINTEEK